MITFTCPSRVVREEGSGEERKRGRGGGEIESEKRLPKKCLKSRGWRALSPQFSWRDYWGISANACF